MKKLKIFIGVVLCFVVLGFLTNVSPSTTTYIKYEHVYDWNDPNSDKFDPMRLDMGYYQGMEKKAKAIDRAFPIGLPKEEFERIIKGKFTYVYTHISDDKSERHVYRYLTSYYEWLYFIPIPAMGYQNYSFVFDQNNRISERYMGRKVLEGGSLEGYDDPRRYRDTSSPIKIKMKDDL